MEWVEIKQTKHLIVPIDRGQPIDFDVQLKLNEEFDFSLIWFNLEMVHF